MAITVHLSEVLKARNMTSKELCAKVGITEANLSILRSGKASGVRFHTINKICYYLNCDVGDILRFEDDWRRTMNKRFRTGILILIPVILLALLSQISLAQPEETHA